MFENETDLLNCCKSAMGMNDMNDTPRTTYKEAVFDKKIGHDVLNHIFGLQMMCHGIARESGWWTCLKTGGKLDRNDGELFALMHSEISEALEAFRKGAQDDHLQHRPGVEVELADLMIRVLDYAGGRNLDLAGAFLEKLQYNCNRADHKIENRKAEGGKKI